MILEPLALPLMVYSAAYFIAWTSGLVQFSPGAGKWTTGAQIAANLAVNLAILLPFGTFTALGEELGWARLSTAAARCCRRSPQRRRRLARAARLPPAADGRRGLSRRRQPALDGPALRGRRFVLHFPSACLAYRARSLWPAVFFHSFHNTISQWLFPKFFVGGDPGLLLGETGLLPALGYVVLGVAVLLALRREGPPWHELARSARPIM